MSDLHYDPYSEEALRDPYAIYKRLRAEKPAYYMEKYDAWALSRFIFHREPGAVGLPESSAAAFRERRKNPSEEPAHG